VFIVYVAVTLAAWQHLRWSLPTGLLALAVSLPPPARDQPGDPGKRRAPDRLAHRPSGRLGLVLAEEVHAEPHLEEGGRALRIEVIAHREEATRTG
jgi:hypothetical protein